MTYLIIPSIVLMIIIYGLYKKQDIYDLFLEGVQEGLKMALKIFPTMFAMVIAVDILVLEYVTSLPSFLITFMSIHLLV